MDQMQRLAKSAAAAMSECDSLFASFQHCAFRSELTGGHNPAAAIDTVEASAPC
jgi:hypothetical protein